MREQDQLQRAHDGHEAHPDLLPRHRRHCRAELRRLRRLYGVLHKRGRAERPAGGNPATQKWIKFENETAQSGSGLDVRILFSEPVSKLSFTLFDLDWADGNHRDAVIATTPPTSFTLAPALQGSGTVGSPWRRITVGEIPSTSLNGNVQLNYAGPITEVRFRYFQDLPNLNRNHNQLIGLSDLAFDKCI